MKFTPGPMIGAASGSVGGQTFSRNRYGAYVRTRAVPTDPNTSYQVNARARLGTLSTGWGALTAAQRLSWREWAKANPVIDALGQPQILSGNAAYIQLNTRILQAGETIISAPPTSPAPDALTSLTLNGDIGTGTFDITFTATPLGATEHLWVREAVTNSAGINYVRNLLRVVTISSAAQATGLDNQTELEARLGALVAGQTLHAEVSVFDNATGLLSAPLKASVVITDTP